MSTNWVPMKIDDIKAPVDGAIAIGPFGSRMKAEVYTLSGVPVIRGTNISDTRGFQGEFVFVSDETANSLRNCNVYADDLVFPHRGAIGEVGIVPKDGKRYMISTSLMKLTCDLKKVVPLFLFYYFRSPVGRFELLKNASTVGTPGIGQPLTTLKSITINLPNLSIQRRIADILCTLDDKIELNRQMNETLEAMARRLFRSWFIDFDPVHAKAAARREFPSLDNAELSRRALPNMSPEIAELFPDTFQDSPLGPIPKGWKAGTVPDAIDINPTRSIPKGKKVPWLEMSNMPTHSARALAWDYREFTSGTKFMNGDTLVARITPCLENGKTAFVDFLEDGQVGAGSTEYIVLRPKVPLPPGYAYFLARTEEFRQHLIANMTGTSGRQRAPAESLNSFPTVIPSKEICMPFKDAIEKIIEQMRKADFESHELTTIRDRLLPSLLSGEIDLERR